jgi:hypothetical protein
LPRETVFAWPSRPMRRLQNGFAAKVFENGVNVSATAIISVHRGKAIPERQSLWSFAGSASEIKNKRATRPLDNVLTGPIDKSQIKIFGKPLPGSGYIFKTLADGKTFDIPFKVEGQGSDFYKFGITPSPLYLISRCACPREDLDRTTVGVAEQVYLYWSASLAGTGFPNGTCPSDGVECEPITWETSAGSLSSSNTWQTTFTAPSNETDTVTVAANVRDEKCKIDFKVIEPSGIKATKRNLDVINPPYPHVGAGMTIDVVLLPTTVSFYKVQIEEPQEPATGTGYCANNPPQHTTAGVWYYVDCNNKVLGPPVNFFDHAYDSVHRPIGAQGTYTWPIHAVWRVVGATSTHSLNGWTEQKYTLSPDGTVRIDKFGLHVTRGPYEPSGT